MRQRWCKEGSEKEVHRRRVGRVVEWEVRAVLLLSSLSRELLFDDCSWIFFLLLSVDICLAFPDGGIRKLGQRMTSSQCFRFDCYSGAIMGYLPAPDNGKPVRVLFSGVIIKFEVLGNGSPKLELDFSRCWENT